MNESELTVQIESYSHDVLTGCSWWKRECFDEARWLLTRGDGTIAYNLRACDKHAARMVAEWIDRDGGPR